MKTETERWLEQADTDVAAAQHNYKGEFYEYAAFFCQQAVEKGLKALLLEQTGQVRKIHDLVQLARTAELPEHMIGYCKEITAAYVHTRYPDTPGTIADEETAAQFIQWTEEVLEWIQTHL